MSDIIIRVENLSKKYLIGANRTPKYTSLRDVMKARAQSLLKKLMNPINLGYKSNLKSGKKNNSAPSEFWALKDVALEIEQGQVLGIIGNNGAGKSTLLKILARITAPTTGRIVLNGRVASLLEIGTGFHPELTGRENIFLNGSILGMDRHEIRRKFDEIVDFADIEKFLDTPVKQYSSGMYTRLAFAVAAHLEPEILIVDEVLAVGDAAFQEKCLGKIEAVSTKEGRTVLFVSHNLGMVQKLCDTCLYLDGGRVAGYGQAATVIKQYMHGLRLTSSSVQFESRVSETEFSDEFTAEISGEFAANLNILEISVRDARNHEAPSFSFTQDFCLSVSYKITQAISELYIYFTIINQDGIRVLLSCTTDYASLMDDGKPVKPGTYNSQVFVPGHLLIIGKYYVDLSMTIADSEVENRQRCLAFEITPEASVNYDWQQRPLIYPNLKWQTKCLD